MNKKETSRIDWLVTLVPFILIVGLTVLLLVFPDRSNEIIGQVRFFFGDTVGLYYLVIGLGILVVSAVMALSKYGDIVLGEPFEKPKYNFFEWGHPFLFLCRVGNVRYKPAYS